MRATLGLTIAAALSLGSLPAAEARDENQLTTGGILVSLPAGKTRRVGVRNAEGTTWLAVPTRRNYLEWQVFHRLRQLPMGAYVRLSGKLLSTDPLRLGPDTIESGERQEWTVEVSDDGKTATWNGVSVRLHAWSSIPDNSPTGLQTTSQAALLERIKGKRAVIKGFTFKTEKGLPSDLFLDEVQVIAHQATPLLARKANGPDKELMTLPAGTKLWVSSVDGDYARGQYVERTSPRSTTSHGGSVRAGDVVFARPKKVVTLPAASGSLSERLSKAGERK